MRLKYGDTAGSFGIRYIEASGKDSKNNKLAKFECHCGTEFIGKQSAVLADRRKSCGCLSGKGSASLLERKDPDPEPWNKILVLDWFKMPDLYAPDQFSLNF